jgi:triosephosphate isomerase
MRKKIVAGNWKMNLDSEESSSLIKELNECNIDGVDVLIFPPSIYLEKAIQAKNSIGVGAQNCYFENSGAFTGEISPQQIKSIGAEYALVGHSERRSIFGESHGLLKNKVDALLNNSITVVFCCGEIKEDRESGNQNKIVEQQLNESLFHIAESDFRNIVIAYEPVWAIGTGLTASSDQAEEMHAFIRNLIASKYSEKTAQETSILYGGSCKPDNAKDIFSKENVDGGLIGGAALKSDSFIAIANSF